MAPASKKFEAGAVIMLKYSLGPCNDISYTATMYFSYTILTKLHAPNTYQSKLVPSDSVNNIKCEAMNNKAILKTGNINGKGQALWTLI